MVHPTSALVNQTCTWDHLQLIKVRTTVDLMADLEFFFKSAESFFSHLYS